MSSTIRDIKDRTGLSLATISKFLNGGNVLPENRVLLENAIKELNYEPNELARGLVTNKTRTIGVIVYDIGSMFNGTLLRHIGQALKKERYGLLICDSRGDEAAEAENVRFLVNKKVDGMIVLPISRSGSFLQPARSAGIPVVLIDRPVKDYDIDCVRIDNRKAAHQAVSLLIANNHKRIAVICSDEKNEYTGYERFQGYLDAMTEAGMTPFPEYIKKRDHSIEFGHEGMGELLKLENPPTAVFMSNYELSLGAVMAVNESGLGCPDDISLVGFDDLILSHIVRPKLYMVVQPMKEMGEKAVETLLSKIESKGEGFTSEIIMSTRISDGNSIARIQD
ncbi:MAG: LacI family transcriptional regulator [Lachnospiraceae bacterium]|nr:LacI family transcriptional regulator [Lachnospiraceae bacterium]